MKLAEKILALSAQEKADGAAIVAACESLKESLTNASAKIEALSEEISSLAEDVQMTQYLKKQIAELQAELAEANVAADAIAEINTAPVTPEVTEVVEPENVPNVASVEPIE